MFTINSYNLFRPYIYWVADNMRDDRQKVL